MSQPTSKKQRTNPSYFLLYHPGLPGRGEFIRLLLEASGASYTDVGNTDKTAEVYEACDADSTGLDGNPPCFSPPMLRVPGAGKDGAALLISQTPNIIFYLGEELGLAGEGVEKWWVNELALAALDLNNETHDTHHPVATMEYYEDQKVEAKRKATDFRKNRIPKFFGYFERALKGNEEKGKGRYLVGNGLTFADLTFWQVVDGLQFAFPKELKAREDHYPLIFQTFYPSIKEEPGIKEYLQSDRRLKYGNGIFRHYPELDRE